MTTAPLAAEDFLDFVVTDPGTIRARLRRLPTPSPVCRQCQPNKVASALLSGAETYSSCVVCACSKAAS